MTQEITNKALQWARYELAAREAEDEELGKAEGVGSLSDSRLTTSPGGAEANIDRPTNPREAANSILEELTPLFAEQARIRRWNEMRPGKEPRLI